MSTLKKILALSLALAMILSVSVFAGNYSADTYKDAAAIDKDAAEAVELLYALKIMTGDEKGNFNPNATITRAEVAKMIYVILNKGNDDKAATYAAANLFTDVPATAWYAGYINYLAALGLVNGSEGKFYPTNPVKTAEAAKMLLTAIGYNAEDRQYVGANWAKNVQSDAYIVGLLSGYKADINGAAPRQWVAVMFNNALLEAYTYATVYPAGFNGIFNNTAAGKTNFLKFGEKYYGLKTFTGYLFATDGAFIDTTERSTGTASSGKVIFATKTGAENTTDKTEWIQVKNPGLGYMDLGQQFRVIYKDGDSTVYSARATGKSDVAEGRMMDYSVKVDYNTDKNLAANEYVFSVGDAELSVAAKRLCVLTLDGDLKSAATVCYDTAAKVKAQVVTAKNKVKNPDINADIYKVIDRDGNGTIDYVIVTKYAYAQITKVDSSKYYGDYVNAEKVNGSDLTYSKTSAENLYLDDCIICDTELEENNIVKYSWNPDEAKFNFEVLPVSTEVKYEKRSSSKGIHVLGGEEYMVSEKGWDTTDVLVSGNLGENVDFVTDGDLIVLAVLTESNYADIADVNAQLVLVTDVNDEFSNQGIFNKNAIEYMDINGETHIAAYLDKSGFVSFSELYKLSSTQYHTEIQDGKVVAVKNWDNYTYKGRLFILHESGSKVYLEALNNDGKNPYAQLNASKSLLDGYCAKDGKLDATGSTARFANMKLVGENDYFVGYEKNGSPVYKVIKADDLSKGSDNGAYAQLLTKENSRGTVTTAVAGYLNFNLEAATSTGYLYITDVSYEDEDGIAYTVVTDDSEGEIQIYLSKTSRDAIKAKTLKIAENILYSYSYNKVDDVYTLTMVEFTTEGRNFECEIFDLDGDKLYAGSNKNNPTVSELDKETIAIVDVTVELEVGDENNHDPLAFKYGDITAKFVDLADLEANMIVNDEYEGQGVQRFSDYKYGANDLLYVIVYHVENYANSGATITGDMLYDGLMDEIF